jgi:DNA-binding XRE family transcriptional regulator
VARRRATADTAAKCAPSATDSGLDVVVSETVTTFGERVREHRRAAGLTQEQLAERAGVSPRSISELERGGAHVPRRDTVALLARALNLVGQERAAYEALVHRPRRPRPATGRACGPHQATPEAVAQRRQHNVPRALTSFVGRERDLSELARILPTTPILTLVGAGGVGKMRLAEELVRTHASAYPDGGWLVELAGLTDPALLPSAVATAVGLGSVQPHRTGFWTHWSHSCATSTCCWCSTIASTWSTRVPSS